MRTYAHGNTRRRNMPSFFLFPSLLRSPPPCGWRNVPGYACMSEDDRDRFKSYFIIAVIRARTDAVE